MATTTVPPRTPPTRPKLRARYEERRERLIAVAAKEFASRGYHETSIDHLVVASGLQRGGIYHYIESKEQLLLLIHDQLLEPLLLQARETRSRRDDPKAELRELLRIWVAHVAAHRDHMIVFNEARRLVESGPEWRRVRRQRRQFQDIVADVLQRGVDDGSFEIRDVRVALMSILGVVNYMPQWLDSAGRLSPDEIADHCADLLLQGIVASRGARSKR